MSYTTQIPEMTTSLRGGLECRFWCTTHLRTALATGISAFRFVCVFVSFLLPLIVLPGANQPFSRPKLILWAGVVFCGMLACAPAAARTIPLLPPGLRAVLAVWLGALGVSTLCGQFASLDVLLLPLTGLGWLFLLLAVRLNSRRLSWALALSGTAIAIIALTQFLNVDPFAAIGWLSTSGGNARMRVFATLGNPNFVAAFLAGLLPLTFSLASTSRWRRLLLGFSALQLAAILATGSRAPILTLPPVLLWISRVRAWRFKRTVFLGAVLIAVATAIFSPARDLKTSLEGRFYIWRVSAPHVAEHFLLGLGPGGFAASFPAWETQYWRDMPDESERKFAGVEDHAHNDYLEIFADYGAVGGISFLAVLLTFLWGAARERYTRDPLSAGASTGIVAVAAVALVDFPLMRPAEAFLFWSLMAISLHHRCQTAAISKPTAASDESERKTT